MLAETDKHVVSICESGGSLYYRGEAISSGSAIFLDATWEGGGSYRAVNPGTSDTVYFLTPSRLTVTTGTKVILDTQMLAYNDFN